MKGTGRAHCRRLRLNSLFGQTDSLKTTRRYVECINARDVDGLRRVIGEQCRLIDARGDWIEGRETCLEALQRFFDLEAHYRLQIETIGRNGDDVLITGRATADDPRFATSTIFRARADDRHLHEWQSYSPVQGLAICRLLAGEKAQLGPFPTESY